MMRRTLADVRRMFPDCYVEVSVRSAADGKTYPAIYVWEDEQSAADEDNHACLTTYWLADA